MAGRFEDIIQKQEALIAALEEQHAADQKLIHLQEQQIQALQEKTVLLEKKQALADAGNDMAAACGRLEKKYAASSRNCWRLFTGPFQNRKHPWKKNDLKTQEELSHAAIF